MTPYPKVEMALATMVPSYKPELPSRLSDETLKALEEAIWKVLQLVPHPRWHRLADLNSGYRHELFRKLRFVIADHTYVVSRNYMHIERYGIILDSGVLRRDTSINTAEVIAGHIASGKVAEGIRQAAMEEEAREVADVLAYGERYQREQKLVEQLQQGDFEQVSPV